MKITVNKNEFKKVDVIINTLEKETSVIGVIDSVKEPTTVIFKTF